MKIKEFDKYKNIQKIAKIVLEEIKEYLTPESSERTIVEECTNLLTQNGIFQTWYYNCPALVLLGTRSCVSISGKNYMPSLEKIGLNNLVTIDLSPLDNDIWGDCARSYVIENGKIKEIDDITNTEYQDGLKIEMLLHEHLLKFTKPEMTFDTVYREMNNYITNLGYVNIDFMKNIGHTIEKNRNDRLYFEEGNLKRLSLDKLYTFEPHVKKIDGKWGYKCENIYYFNENELIEL